MTVKEFREICTQLTKVEIYEKTTRVQIYKGIVFTIPHKYDIHEIAKLTSNVLGVVVLNVVLK